MDRCIKNALHGIAHVQGPYWAAAVVNTYRGRQNHIAFRWPLVVSPSGEVYGAAHSYRLYCGDLPPVKGTWNALVVRSK